MSVRASSQVWKWATTSGTRLVMLLAIADYANNEGHAWPSMNTLAEKCRISKRQAANVIRELVELEELEIIEAGGGRGKPNTYRVNCISPYGQNETVKSAAPIPEKRVKPDAQKDEIQRQERVKSSSTEPSVNHQEPLIDSQPAGSKQNQIRRELAEHFSKESGIAVPNPKTKKERKRAGALWYTPLREICALADWKPRKAEGLVSAAIKRLDHEDLTIASPNSILKTTEAIKAEIQRGKYHE